MSVSLFPGKGSYFRFSTKRCKLVVCKKKVCIGKVGMKVPCHSFKIQGCGKVEKRHCGNLVTTLSFSALVDLGYIKRERLGRKNRKGKKEKDEENYSSQITIPTR